MKHIDELPIEMLLHILSFLSLRNLFAVEHVSLHWRDAFNICLSRLRDFTMGWPHAITDRCLELLLPRMSALRVIDIDVYDRETLYTQINRLDLHLVANHCPLLSELNLNPFRVSESSLQRLCLRCPRLEVVTMNAQCSEPCLRVILQNQRLRALTVRSPEGRAWLALVPDTLQRLSLTHWTSRMSGDLRHLARCRDLRELDLSFCNIMHSTQLKFVLGGCPRLERLRLTSSVHFHGESLHLDAAAPASLRELDISDAYWVTADVLSAGLACCPRLECFSAARLAAPLELCLPPAGLPALRRLNVRHTEPLTDDSLRRLPDLLPGLRSLTVSFCRQLTEQGLLSLRRLPELRELHLAGVPSVSDVTLYHLSAWPLTELELGCAETFPKQVRPEAVLRFVLECRSLRRLTLYDRLSRVRPVVEGLRARLGKERDVTLVLYPGFPSRLPRTDRPLRLTDTTATRRAAV